MTDPASGSVASAAMGAAAPAVQNALVEFGKMMSANVGRVAKTVSDRAIVALQLGFNEYLVTSYNRCRTFKSILAPQEPIELLSHYVNVTLTCASKTTTDYDLSDQIHKKGHVVVTGLAGSGKSMFMKYLTISHFENPQGRIPLFVELRHLNSLTDQNLLTFIRSSCTSKSHNVSEDQFSLSLRSGAMILILDGFDELHHEIRDLVQGQILALSKDYPNTTIVVSSRPDDRFNSWHDYYVYKVDELTQAQTEKLIASLEYNPGVKRRFLKEVSSRLYKSHKSFLSSPLLASIMLLTFEEFAEIPQKMHAFYGQAFDTLFQKHDAQKEQYQRKTHTALTRELFKSCFSTFCALSYLEQQFFFSDEKLTQTSERAVNYMKQTSEFPSSVTADGFVKDLFESVCMLQKDGIDTTFAHRSFQEYFAALFIGSLPSTKIKMFLDRYCTRFNDSVIPMSIDIYRSLVEAEWVLPVIGELRSTLNLRTPKSNLGDKLQAVFPSLAIHNHKGEIVPTAFGFEDSEFVRIESLSRSYPKHLQRNSMFSRLNGVDLVKLRDKILTPANRGRDTYDAIERFVSTDGTAIHFSPRVPRGKRPSHIVDARLGEDHDWWLQEIGLARAFEDLAKGLNGIEREIKGRDRRRDNILQDFFE